MNLEPKPCMVCQKVFTPKTMKGKYCSTDCSRKSYSKKYYQKQTSSDPDFFKKVNIMSRYGMTMKDWARMFSEQGESCAICNESPEGEQWSVDHCHKTGKVRGILCRKCNTGLGAFDDDIEKMIEATLYISRSQGLTISQISKEVKLTNE